MTSIFAWFFIGGGVFIGLTNIALKLASTKGVGLVPIAFYFMGVGAGLLAYALWQKPQALALNLANPVGLSWALAGVVVGIASNLLLFTALGKGAPAGLGFTMFNVVSTLTTLALGYFFLKEVITPLHLAGVALAILSVVFMSWQGKVL